MAHISQLQVKGFFGGGDNLQEWQDVKKLHGVTHEDLKKDSYSKLLTKVNLTK